MQLSHHYVADLPNPNSAHLRQTMSCHVLRTVGIRLGRAIGEIPAVAVFVKISLAVVGQQQEIFVVGLQEELARLRVDREVSARGPGHGASVHDHRNVAIGDHIHGASLVL